MVSAALAAPLGATVVRGRRARTAGWRGMPPPAPASPDRGADEHWDSETRCDGGGRTQE